MAGILVDKNSGKNAINVIVGAPSTLKVAEIDKHIDIIKKSLSTHINFEDFDIITSCETVSKPKPSSDIYEYVLSELKINAAQTIAIEDTKANQNAATNSGIRCYLYPGEYSVLNYKDTKDLEFVSDGKMLPSLLSD